MPGTITAAEAAAAAGTELFVFTGSCAMYGSVAELPVGEDHDVAPSTPDGSSKAAALSYVEWFARHHDLPVTSLILGNVYGPGRGGGQGGVIDQLVAAAAAGRPSVLHGDASATRDFVHGADVAEAALRAFMRPTAGRVSIGSRVETSVARVHALISDATEWTIPPRRGAPLAGEIDRMCLRGDRAAALLGWVPRFSLADGIAALTSAALG